MTKTHRNRRRTDDVLRLAYVEDNDLDAEQFLTSWQEEGILNPVDRYRTAEAYFDAKTSAQPPHYGILLVDLQLPGMSGQEFISRERALPNRSRKAIVIVTGSDEWTAEFVAKSTRGMVHAWAAKPVIAASVHRIIRELVKRKSTDPTDPRFGLRIVEIIQLVPSIDQPPIDSTAKRGD